MFLTTDVPLLLTQLHFKPTDALSFVLCIVDVVKRAMLFPVQSNYDSAHHLLGRGLHLIDEILRLSRLPMSQQVVGLISFCPLPTASFLFLRIPIIIYPPRYPSNLLSPPANSIPYRLAL